MVNQELWYNYIERGKAREVECDRKKSSYISKEEVSGQCLNLRFREKSSLGFVFGNMGK